jgi:hypothetical protein
MEGPTEGEDVHGFHDLRNTSKVDIFRVFKNGSVFVKMMQQ